MTYAAFDHAMMYVWAVWLVVFLGFAVWAAWVFAIDEPRKRRARQPVLDRLARVTKRQRP